MDRVRHAPGLRRCTPRSIVEALGPRPGKVPTTFPRWGNVGPAVAADDAGRRRPTRCAGRPGAVHGRRLRPQHRHGRDRLVTAAPVPPLAPAPAGLRGSTGRHRPRRVVAAGRRCPGTATGTWHVLDNAADARRPSPSAPCCACTATRRGPTCGARLVAAGAAASGRGGWSPSTSSRWGSPSGPGEPHRLADRIADLGALTDALGLAGPVVTVGHDWGGLDLASAGRSTTRTCWRGVVLTNTAVHHDRRRRACPPPLRLAMAPGVLPAGTVAHARRSSRPRSRSRTRRWRPTVADGFRAPYRDGRPPRRRSAEFVADIPADADHPSRPALERDRRRRPRPRRPGAAAVGPARPGVRRALPRATCATGCRTPTSTASRAPATCCAEDADVAGAVVALARRARPASVRGPPRRPSDRRAARLPAAVAARSRSARRTTASRWSSWRRPAAAGRGPCAGRCSPAASTSSPAGCAAPASAAGTGSRLLVPPGADLTAVLYACLRLGAVVVVADAGLGVRGLSRAVRGGATRPSSSASRGRSRRPARSAGRRGGSAPAPAAPPRGPPSASSASLAELADAGRADAAADRPRRPSPARTTTPRSSSPPARPARQGRRYTHARLAAMRAVRSATPTASGPDTPLVAAFAPFALLGPALGATCASPDMDVTSPAHAHRARAGRTRSPRSTPRSCSPRPAALASVVRRRRRRSTTPVAARSPACGCSSRPARRSPPELLAAAGRLMPTAEPHTPYGMTEVAAGRPTSASTSIRGRRSGRRASASAAPSRASAVAISALDDAGAADRPGRHERPG